METRAHHVLIGTFAILAFVLGLGFVLWLSKTSADSAFGYYDVIFTEAVTGLSKGGLVQYNGIKVGEVTQLKLAPDDPRKVIARIRLDGDTPVKVDTEAKLGLLGVTGTAFIQLSGGKPNSKPLLPTAAHPVPVILAGESALSKLLSSGDDIVTSVNQSLMRVGQLLSKENIEHVSSTLKHFDAVASTIAEQRGDMAKALGQLADASGELKSTLSTLHEMASTTNELINTDVRKVMASTDKAIKSIDRVADSAESLLNENQSAIASFSDQGLRQVGPTLIDLRETLRSFKQLSDQLGNSNTLLLGRDQPKEFKPK
ncbi:MAG TPA: MlaD family protein [Dokdonella sp.]|uniref:MlaD family protein n=1 Tax=Dokdonella sp. TaxID=2291710 RepID=UPI002D7FF417|nr:MlaD family protein [Dokdonella sp.]HET9034478.1 MlaD family protein [Dokdonella sp.]